MNPVDKIKIDLLEKYFLNRTDRIAVMAKWKKTCPAEPLTPIRSFLTAHVVGSDAPMARANLLPPGRHEEFTDHFRIGSYGPAIDGTTKWACIDIDGGNHAYPVEDPEGATIAIAEALFNVGVLPNIERSFSGTGWHLWILFSPPLPADDVKAAILHLIPKNIKLKGGGFADPMKSAGVELFPKQGAIKPDGYGSHVYLPFNSNAQGSANEFHVCTLQNELVPYQPKTLKSTPEEVIAKLAKEAPPVYSSIPRPKSSSKSDDPWKLWRREALPLLPLEPIFGEYMTGVLKNAQWAECRDPDSPTGDRNPSAGVSTGEGPIERGRFYSFISGKGMSVFDFLIKYDLTVRNFQDACARVRDLSGVPFPC